MARILVRSSRAEILMLGSDQPGLPSKHTKKLLLGLNDTQIRPNEHDIVAISAQLPDISGYQDSRHGF